MNTNGFLNDNKDFLIPDINTYKNEYFLHIRPRSDANLKDKLESNSNSSNNINEAKNNKSNLINKKSNNNNNNSNKNKDKFTPSTEAYNFEHNTIYNNPIYNENNLASDNNNKFLINKYNFSNDLSTTKRVEEYLKSNANNYINEFINISKEAINNNYQQVFEDIFNFTNKLDNYEEIFLQCLLLNSDQNSTIFYELFENYISSYQNKVLDDYKCNDDSSNNYIFYTNIFESSFKDIKKLFTNLDLYTIKEEVLKKDNRYASKNYNEDNEKDYNDCNNRIEHYCKSLKKKELKRIIIIRNINKTNSVELNALISKLIDYNTTIFKQKKTDKIKSFHPVYNNNQDNPNAEDDLYNFEFSKRMKYKNILIFDVAHDPTSMFNKLQPNVLAKMVFNNLSYTPSRHIYKSIIYDYIRDNGNIFFPKKQNLAKLIFYIDNYQLSFSSFINYFKWLIMEFFYFRHWKDESYLIFDYNIKQASKYSDEFLSYENNLNEENKDIYENLKIEYKSLLDIIGNDRNFNKFIERIFTIRMKELGIHYNENCVNNIYDVNKKKKTIIRRDENINRIEELTQTYNSLSIKKLKFFVWFDAIYNVLLRVQYQSQSNNFKDSKSINSKNIKERTKPIVNKENFFFSFLTLGYHIDDSYDKKLKIFIEEINKIRQICYYESKLEEDNFNASKDFRINNIQTISKKIFNIKNDYNVNVDFNRVEEEMIKKNQIENCLEFVFNVFLVECKEALNKFQDDFKPGVIKLFNKLINLIKSFDNNYDNQTETKSRREELLKNVDTLNSSVKLNYDNHITKNENRKYSLNIDMPNVYCNNKDINDIFITWFKSSFIKSSETSIVDWIDKYNKIRNEGYNNSDSSNLKIVKAHFNIGNYNNFEQITNPNMERLVMSDYKLIASESIYKNNIEYNEVVNNNNNTNNNHNSESDFILSDIEMENNGFSSNNNKNYFKKSKKHMLNTVNKSNKKSGKKQKLNMVIKNEPVSSDNHSYDSLNQLDDDTYSISKKNNKKKLKYKSILIKNIHINKIYSSYLSAFGAIGYEFKLKNLYYNFLSILNINWKFNIVNSIDNNSASLYKDNMENCNLIFLKISHEFYFKGLFHKKKGKNSDIFIKNYYENKGFFDN